MKSVHTKILLAALLTLGISAANALADTREFCAGFERGYITGYKKAKHTDLDPLVPMCPMQPMKRFGDPDSEFEHGYGIGYERGLSDGR
ncbi:MAG TPA: hypothetical protein DCM36_05215 [Xanthomonadaceae bacterium]|nr:hypothetical protein [Xanthomonadaceae bacterium]